MHVLTSPHNLRLQALDVDADTDADLVLALDGKPPAIWLNPGLATSGIHPTGNPTATEGIIFTLDATLNTTSDVALADVNGDGRTDIVLAYGTGFEVILAPNKDTSTTWVADWKAAGLGAKKVAAPAMRIKVADMDNDGYPDIVASGASPSSADADRTKTTIYFGSAATNLFGNYQLSVATSAAVGNLTYAEAGEVLVMDVADVDGDGWQDVAVTYTSTYKRVYFGTRQARVSAGWPAAEARRFGPIAQDEWQVTSLELVDLNLDGNLDVLYAPACTNPYAQTTPAGLVWLCGSGWHLSGACGHPDSAEHRARRRCRGMLSSAALALGALPGQSLCDARAEVQRQRQRPARATHAGRSEAFGCPTVADPRTHAPWLYPRGSGCGSPPCVRAC